MTDKKLVFIGYSGHSFGCIEIALSQGYLIDGYFDLKEKHNNFYNLRYLGSDTNINAENKPFISIGNNCIRRKIYEMMSSKSIPLDTSLIHSNSIISKSSFINQQTLINAGVIVNPQCTIGLGCILNTGSIIEHDCKVGEFSHIAPGAVLCGNVTIGKGSLIGANAVIKQGVSVGDNVTVGAGAVVTEDINCNAIVVGNPAKPI